MGEKPEVVPSAHFLNLWRSICVQQQCKLKRERTTVGDVSGLKRVLCEELRCLCLVHHRRVAKGDVLYFAARMHGVEVLFEVALAVNGRLTVVVRSTLAR